MTPRISPMRVLLAVGATALAMDAAVAAPESRYFAIQVVDEQTGRGVPLVELKTVHNTVYYTDSGGYVAFDEPGLMDRKVFFHVKSHGYEFPADGFGIRGRALEVKEGGTAVLKIRRLNLAERLYRVTGGGIYRDTVLLGKKPPVREPVLNGLVLGSDSVQNAIYRGKLHWFWGDTNWPAYPLGNFNAPGAVSDLPGKGGLDPSAGVDLRYYTREDGFAKEVAPVPGSGPTWIDGIVTLKDRDGRERMFAGYAKIKPPLEVYERGLIEWDDAAQQFRKVLQFDKDSPFRTKGHPLTVRESGTEYFYFADPFPITRVRADVESLKDPTAYECFTPLKPGSRIDRPEVDRGPDGNLRYAWKKGAPPLDFPAEAKLVQEGKLKPEETRLQIKDLATGKPVHAHGGSVAWNDYRKRWTMVFVQIMGEPSMLGEVWYAEADAPEGPWTTARRIVTHDRQSFYNPKQHPYFAQEGGRLIYFEGTYTSSFSGNPEMTPRYEYNQVMYRLDLADPRLELPPAGRNE